MSSGLRALAVRSRRKIKKPLAVDKTGGAVTARIGRLPLKGSLTEVAYPAPHAPSRIAAGRQVTIGVCRLLDTVSRSARPWPASMILNSAESPHGKRASAPDCPSRKSKNVRHHRYLVVDFAHQCQSDCRSPPADPSLFSGGGSGPFANLLDCTFTSIHLQCE